MSFAFTTAQFRARTKFVTRRRGWWSVKLGEQVMAVEKAQGLKKGERVVELGVIEIVEATLEPLNRLVYDLDYGRSEMILEGFPGLDPAEFVRRFYDSHRCTRQSELIRRIRFRYIDVPR